MNPANIWSCWACGVRCGIGADALPLPERQKSHAHRLGNSRRGAYASNYSGGLVCDAILMVGQAHAGCDLVVIEECMTYVVFCASQSWCAAVRRVMCNQTSGKCVVEWRYHLHTSVTRSRCKRSPGTAQLKVENSIGKGSQAAFSELWNVARCSAKGSALVACLGPETGSNGSSGLGARAHSARSGLEVQHG